MINAECWRCRLLANKPCSRNALPMLSASTAPTVEPQGQATRLFVVGPLGLQGSLHSAAACCIPFHVVHVEDCTPVQVSIKERAVSVVVPQTVPTPTSRPDWCSPSIGPYPFSAIYKQWEGLGVCRIGYSLWCCVAESSSPYFVAHWICEHL